MAFSVLRIASPSLRIKPLLVRSYAGSTVNFCSRSISCDLFVPSIYISRVNNVDRQNNAQTRPALDSASKLVSRKWSGRRCENIPSVRWSSSRGGSDDDVENRLQESVTANKEQNDPSLQQEDQPPLLVYEGPFAALSLRLKRISLTSAVVGIAGLPLLTFFNGGGGEAGVPVVGQLAVLGTAGVFAVGSTALLGYCFSPYVHSLERLPPGAEGEMTERGGSFLLRAVTRDLFARRVETVFDPKVDVGPPPEKSSRPFCNFVAKGFPLYIHPELMEDQELMLQLVGKEEEPTEKEAESEEKAKKKLEDDDFL